MAKIGTLFIFSGLPASGKTTLASKLASHLSATYLRIDTVEASLRDGLDMIDLGTKCYRVAHFIARENLLLGNSVVGDSVNPVGLSRAAWNDVAKLAGSNFVNIEVVCANKEEHYTRLKNRTTTVAGLKDPTWQEIQDRDYHVWDSDRILLETSGKNAEASFSELLFVLNERFGWKK